MIQSDSYVLFRSLRVLYESLQQITWQERCIARLRARAAFEARDSWWLASWRAKSAFFGATSGSLRCIDCIDLRSRHCGRYPCLPLRYRFSLMALRRSQNAEWKRWFPLYECDCTWPYAQIINPTCLPFFIQEDVRNQADKIGHQPDWDFEMNLRIWTHVTLGKWSCEFIVQWLVQCLRQELADYFDACWLGINNRYPCCICHSMERW